MLTLIGILLFLAECYLLLVIPPVGLLLFFPITFVGCGCIAFDEAIGNNLF